MERFTNTRYPWVNLYHLNDMHMFSDENLTVSFEEFLMGESYQKQIHDILTVLVFFSAPNRSLQD